MAGGGGKGRAVSVTNGRQVFGFVFYILMCDDVDVRNERGLASQTWRIFFLFWVRGGGGGVGQLAFLGRSQSLSLQAGSVITIP